MQTDQIKAHYDVDVAARTDGDYEFNRWHSSPLLTAAFQMTADTINWLLRQAKIPPGGRILEVGPGPGTWTRQLATLFPRASFTLVDISKSMLTEARRRLIGLAPIDFVETDFSRYRGEPVNFFFSARAVEYFPSKPDFREALRANLVSGGHGLIITKLPHSGRDRLRGRIIPERHRHQLSPRALRRLLEAANCRVLKVTPATVMVPFFRSPRLNRLVWEIMRRLPFGFWTVPWTESYAVYFIKL